MNITQEGEWLAKGSLKPHSVYLNKTLEITGAGRVPLETRAELKDIPEEKRYLVIEVLQKLNI